MASMDRPASVIRFVPTPDQYAWTFGGYEPVMRVRPGDILDLFTEDAFAGNIRSSTDLPSASIAYPFVNPQTVRSTSRAPSPATRWRST